MPAAYCYSLNLKGGKKYVGMTTNLERRLDQHFSGSGSAVTQQCTPVSVHHVQRCKSVSNAKKAETIVYENMRDYHGCQRVRGAGHTRRFPDPEPRTTTSKRRRESSEQGEPDACYRCGRSGHFVADCYARTPAMGYALD